MAKVEVKIQKYDDIYEEIEFIQSSANQWIELPSDIDTNITNLYIDFQYVSSPTTFECPYFINSDTILKYEDGKFKKIIPTIVPRRAKRVLGIFS